MSATTLALAPVAIVAPIAMTPGLFALTLNAADDVTALDMLRAAGEEYRAAQGKFWCVVVAYVLEKGNVATRTAIKCTWADSKDKVREYATKIVNVCEKAIEAGKASQIGNCATFAALQALVPVAPKTPAAPKVGKTDASIGAAIDAEQAEDASAHAGDVADNLQFIKMQAALAKMESVIATMQDSAAQAELFAAFHAIKAAV